MVSQETKIIPAILGNRAHKGRFDMQSEKVPLEKKIVPGNKSQGTSSANIRNSRPIEIITVHKDRQMKVPYLSKIFPKMNDDMFMEMFPKVPAALK